MLLTSLTFHVYSIQFPSKAGTFCSGKFSYSCILEYSGMDRAVEETTNLKREEDQAFS